MTLYNCEKCGMVTRKYPEVKEGELGDYVEVDRLMEALMGELGDKVTGVFLRVTKRLNGDGIAYCLPCGRYRIFREVPK